MQHGHTLTQRCKVLNEKNNPFFIVFASFFVPLQRNEFDHEENSINTFDISGHLDDGMPTRKYV